MPSRAMSEGSSPLKRRWGGHVLHLFLFFMGVRTTGDESLVRGRSVVETFGNLCCVWLVGKAGKGL